MDDKLDLRNHLNEEEETNTPEVSKGFIFDLSDGLNELKLLKIGNIEDEDIYITILEAASKIVNVVSASEDELVRKTHKNEQLLKEYQEKTGINLEEVTASKLVDPSKEGED